MPDSTIHPLAICPVEGATLCAVCLIGTANRSPRFLSRNLADVLLFRVRALPLIQIVGPVSRHQCPRAGKGSVLLSVAGWI
jgi:hypothetical protein